MPGKFIVLYGINNIGKTTQARMLVEHMLRRGMRADYLKYPVYNQYPSGQYLDKVLRSPKQEISEDELQLWFAVNRMQFEPTLKKKLSLDINIVSEDYIGTSLAWGSVKGADESWLKAVNSKLLKESISILLDGQRFVRGIESIHIHETNDKLVEKVRRKHLDLAIELKWHVVNANQPKEKVFNDILTILRENKIVGFI
ncbi:hypothetical protein EPN87_04160 [archaeon]|nr:MAG: hypothetical protein EPN87_04160 [archaeon]